MSPRVLHVIPAIAPRYGGPSVAAVGMCRALSAKGITTLLVATDADGSDRLPVKCGTVGTYDDVPTIFFPRYLSESFKWSASLAKWLSGHVRDFDVVHVHAVFSHSSLAAGRACRHARVPYIVRPLGTLDPWSLSRHPRRKRLLLALGARRLLTAAAAIHYTTIEEQQHAERQLPWLPHGVVAPLGVDDELYRVGSGARVAIAPAVLSMGRLHPKKGTDLLIDAFHAAASTDRLGHWRLIIAGSGDRNYVTSLERLALAGPASARVEFRGWVTGPARGDLLRSARLFALPSHQENFGIALAEAMACGLPALVTPGVNLSADLNSAGAGWVSERTPAALADTLRLAMSSEAELNTRGECARRFAERFRWTHVADALQSLYADVRMSASYVPPDLRPAPQP